MTEEKQEYDIIRVPRKSKYQKMVEGLGSSAIHYPPYYDYWDPQRNLKIGEKLIKRIEELGFRVIDNVQ